MVVLIKSKDKLKDKSKSKKKLSLYNPNSKKNKIKGIFLSFIYLVLAVYYGQREYKDIQIRIDLIQKSLPIEDQNRILPILRLIVQNIFSVYSQNRFITLSIVFRIILLLNTALLTYNVLRDSNNENLSLSIQKITAEIIFYKIIDYFATPIEARSI